MKPPKRVCVYYSQGTQYGARLMAVRRRYPEAHVTAMIPAGHRLPDVERTVADEIIETGAVRYSLLNLRSCWDLLRTIRRARFDYFIVMFDSALLNMLAAMSGARRRECWTNFNQIIRLPRTIPGVPLRFLLRPMRGRLKYAVLRTWAVLEARSKQKKSEGK